MAVLLFLASCNDPAPVRAQLAGITPQFPFAPAQAAPLGGQLPGPNVQWQGADNGNMAVFPDGKTTFWVFGDTFIGPNGYPYRTLLAPAVVNSIAIGYVQNGQFNPYYYYRGGATFDTNNATTTNNPSSFFMDPERYSDSPNITPGTAKDVYSPNNTANPYPNQGNNSAYYDPNGFGPYLYNTDCSRFWTGKPIFYSSTGAYADYKLFVFLNRIESQGLILGNFVARVENPVNAAGGANDPRLWNITYLKLSSVSTAGWQPTSSVPGFPNSPWFLFGAADKIVIGAEAFLGADPGDTQQSMYVFATCPNLKNTILKIPMSALLSAAAPHGAVDISASIQWMNSSSQWTAVGVTGGSVPTASCKDANIPAGGGFTCRLLPGPNNTPGNTWRNVYIDASAPQTIRVRTSTAGPFGPWSDPQTVYKIPELDPTNTPFDIWAPAVNGYNKGIYSQGMASSNGIKCYMAYEIYPFSADPSKIATTYSDDRGSVPPPYPTGCNPGQTGWFLWDNNFYRVKGVPPQTPTTP